MLNRTFNSLPALCNLVSKIRLTKQYKTKTKEKTKQSNKKRMIRLDFPANNCLTFIRILSRPGAIIVVKSFLTSFTQIVSFRITFLRESIYFEVFLFVKTCITIVIISRTLIFVNDFELLF